eukprot:TRINITY_DN11140_c0_g2_i2.p2 TRINITY_DN11140_c0_g2~~TRINITY_DN11140_c0_g2_i2.p2  ORF type:complete len:133 (-),score=22.91 TRINITY_DN11140_c0_g2_i2:619-1017(-)
MSLTVSKTATVRWTNHIHIRNIQPQAYHICVFGLYGPTSLPGSSFVSPQVVTIAPEKSAQERRRKTQSRWLRVVTSGWWIRSVVGRIISKPSTRTMKMAVIKEMIEKTPAKTTRVAAGEQKEDQDLQMLSPW